MSEIYLWMSSESEVHVRFLCAWQRCLWTEWLGSNPLGLLEFWSSWQNWWLPHSHTHFQIYPQLLHKTRVGICDDKTKTLTLLSLSHCATTWTVCWGFLSIWKTNLCLSFHFLVDVFRWCFNISTSCSFLMIGALFYEVQQFLLQHNSPTKWCRYFTVRVVQVSRFILHM